MSDDKIVELPVTDYTVSYLALPTKILVFPFEISFSPTNEKIVLHANGTVVGGADLETMTAYNKDVGHILMWMALQIQNLNKELNDLKSIR